MYPKELAKRIENGEKWSLGKDRQKCLHDACPDCHGTGKKHDGTMCIHFLSCPCPKCTPRF